MRTCTDCERELPLESFPLSRGTRARKAGWRTRRCHECSLTSRREYYETHDKARMFKWRYGITIEQRDAMLAAQGYACAVCRSPEHRGHDWCVDHDHSCCDTKSRSCGSCIRGILCHPCNSALGLMRDDPATLESAITYLRQASVSRMIPT